ncbi:hypothetical protein Tco_0684641 [Tanacetum coccineum]
MFGNSALTKALFVDTSAGISILSLGNRNTIKNWKDVANDARKEFYEKEKESLDLKQEFSSENTSKICLDSTKSTESAAVTKKIEEELQTCDALIERLHEEYIRASMSKISASLDISKVDSEGHKTQAIYRKLYKKCLRSVADKCRMRCPKCRQLIILANKKTIQPAGKDQSVMIATFKTKKVKGCESAPQVCKIASLQEYVGQDFDASDYRTSSFHVFAVHVCKIASLKDFDASDYETSNFHVFAIHMIGILDIRILNTDIHGDNIILESYYSEQVCYLKS